MDADASSLNLLVVGSGLTTLLLASALAYVLLNKNQSKDNATDATLSATSSVSSSEQALDKSQYPAGNLYLYYATQTGTAESFCKQIEREAARHGFYAHVVDIEDVEDASQLQSPCVLLSATYGEGEPTDNSATLAQQLQAVLGKTILGQPMEEKSEDPVSLAHLDFAVFGLGNKQYDHYNAMGKFFFEALRTLGGNPLLEKVGLGDDDADLEGDFETWKDNELWPALDAKYGGEAVLAGADSSSMDKPESPYEIEYVSDAKPNYQLPLEQVHGASRHYFDAVTCEVTQMRELRTPADGGSTVHMEIALPKSVSYQTADNLGILPVQQTSIVKSVANSLGYDLKAAFVVKARNGHEWHGAPFPQPTTVEDYLTHYCDLTALPRRSDLKLLAAYATENVDRTFLNRLAAKEHKDEYQSKLADNYMGWANIVEKCPSLQIPLEDFVDLCPRLQPRFYTTASSSSVHPRHVHVTVAVAKVQRPMDKSLFEGVCSTFLANQSPNGGTIRAFVRPSSFRLPSDASKPILLIGPGTGIAPMRALLQERKYQAQKGKTGGPNIMYFGCKSRKLDYLYQDELEAYVEDGTLEELRVAFSREQSQKVYVQHLLAQHSDETRSLVMDQGAYIYVCGGVKMGHDVQEALKEIVGSSVSNSKEYLGELSAQGRYVQELWA